MPKLSVIDSWEHLVRYHRATTKAMDEHLRASCGHSLDDYDVLHQIYGHDGPIRMGDLAERLLVASSSCNRIVGRLVTAGHLVRSPGQIDRREVLVDLTATGQRLRRRMALVHTRDIEQLFGAPLTQSSHRELDDIFTMLLAARGSHVSDPANPSQA
jgi:DNA-binding MarR family transcriptional regulator